MLEIIPYSEKEHFDTVMSWWETSKEPAPTRAMMPEESTFMVTAEGKPWICVTIYMTNTSEMALVENLVANPEMPGGEARTAAVTWLQKFLENWAFEKGYRKLFCMAYKPSLAKRYRELGYTSTMTGVETFIKTLGE